MNELYEICDKYYKELLNNKINLSANNRRSLIHEEVYYKKVSKKYYQNLMSGSSDIRNIIKFCKIGSMINYDLLIEVLLNIYHPNMIKGPFEKSEVEQNKVNKFYEDEWNNTFVEIEKLITIYAMINRIVNFVRKEYDFTFFVYPYLPQNTDENVNNILLELDAIANYQLNNEKTFESDFNTGQEVIDFIREAKNIHDDYLSIIIDNYEINQALIQELSVIYTRLTAVRTLITKHIALNNVINSSNIELQIYLNFTDELLNYLKERMEKLNYKKVNKLIIKEFLMD